MNCKGGYPSMVFLRSFYNIGMQVLSFSSRLQIIFIFSILGDEVSHVSPFSKSFSKSSDAHSGFSIAWILGSTSGSSRVYIQYTCVVWSAS